MIDGQKVIAIIPARGNSKRLPRKNILTLGSQPLIGWSIDAALKSNFVDDVIVSTDDAEIAKISKELGAIVPFLRPDELSTDIADTYSVILHCLEYLRKYNSLYDIVVILQPTSPLRTSKHIDEALILYRKKSAKSVISVCECDHTPLWTNTLNDDQSLVDFIPPEIRAIRSQDLPQYYRLNGALYVFNVAEYANSSELSYQEGSFAYIMDKKASIDIDTEHDFKLAEFYVLNS